MVLLQPPLKEKIDSLFRDCAEKYKNKEFAEAVSILESGWDLLPYPKVTYDESYTIVEYMIQFCLLAEDYVQARRWANIIFICDLERVDSGKREFLAGRVAFESTDPIMARELFYIADQKSKGRCFEGEEVKYLKFFKEK
ncbi:hypothetical protein [Paenibacillus sp. sgz5001063]|uniref:hypothetical protein n=1 Tax=Paenibacillus sp. sgz5001063 TaxID=3242474 RepID=UPI0036D3ABF7